MWFQGCRTKNVYPVCRRWVNAIVVSRAWAQRSLWFFFSKQVCVCGEFFRGIFQLLLVVVEFKSFKLLVLMGSHILPSEKALCLFACLCVCDVVFLRIEA